MVMLCGNISVCNKNKTHFQIQSKFFPIYLHDQIKFVLLSSLCFYFSYWADTNPEYQLGAISK